MMKLKRYVFPIILLVIVLATSWLFMTNVSLIDELQKDGKQPVSVLPGVPSLKGDKGDSPTVAQVAQAVADYCAVTGSCEGKIPTPATVFAAVSQYCSDTHCQGKPGGKGIDAAPITPTQIQREVIAYCESGQCTGQAGTDGMAGVNGKSPELACVEHPAVVPALSSRYVAWKYTEEPDSAYRDLYKLPTGADCSNPVQVEGAL